MLHQVGAGAAGPVFRAYDPEHDRLVAIKFFRVDLVPERAHQLVADLERIVTMLPGEATITRPLAAGLATIQAFLIQEFVAADSLDVVVRDRGATAVPEAVRVATQLASALDAAAAVEIEHGALHPRDVLLASDFTRLTGLGIARALERVGVTTSPRRPYAAPERIAGRAWDRRADVFSLAAVIHEMLWGRRIGGVGSHVSDALTDLPGTSLAGLRETFERALAEDPADRFDSAVTFAEGLERACRGLALIKPGRARRRGPAPEPPVADEPRLPLDVPDPPIERSSADGTTSNDGSPDPSLEAATSEERVGEVSAPTISEELSGAAQAEEPVPDGESEIRDEPEPAQSLLLAETGEPVPDIERDGRDEFESAQPLLAEVDGPVPEIERGRRDEPEPAQVLLLNAPAASEAAPERELVISRQPVHDEARAVGRQMRADFWPIGLALFVGAALGFAGGYAIGMWHRPLATSSATFTIPAATTPEAVPAAPPPASLVSTLPAPTPEPAPAVAAPAPVRTATAPAVQTRPGQLVIQSTPAGARVLVDGQDRGRTPLTVGDLVAGAHRLRFERDGYAAHERRVMLTRARPTVSVTVRLARARAAAPPAAPRVSQTVGEVTVESRPSGARVSIDGKLVGVTPMNLPNIAMGEHAISIERDGYRRWSSRVRVAGGERSRVAASLEK